MTNALAKASEWLSRMRRAHAATPIVYRRDQQTVEIDAQKLSVAVELDRGDGVTVEAQRTDWIVAIENLILDGQPVTPLEGDRIEQQMGTKTFVYEVIPLGTDSHCRPAGPYGHDWRIHSKLVEVQ
ncbi:MAG: hypothetical protein HQ567_34595 [Candidatus Nealsonbacteria bacterium]|nr:hypothetical protein [Candidatus Nealsonbacteria bacterium]